MIDRALRYIIHVAIGFACATIASLAHAETIIVAGYGITASAMPYALAMGKGYFKEANVDVDKILNLEGPAAISALLEAKLAYAEVSPLAVMQEARMGSRLRIISDNIPNYQDMVWVAPRTSPVNSLQDLRGRRLGYSNVGTTSEAANLLALEKVGVPASTVTLSRAGGIEAGLTYLQLNALDAMPVPEPVWSARMDGSKYKVIARANEILGVTSNLVGIATFESAAGKTEFIHGVLRARRKAIEYMHSDPHGAAIIIAKVYEIEAPTIERVIRTLLRTDQDSEYWAMGEFRPGRREQIAALARLSGSGTDPTSAAKLVDESFLVTDAPVTRAEGPVAEAMN